MAAKIMMECTGCGDRRSDVTMGTPCVECENGHYGEPVGAPAVKPEAKTKRKNNPLQWEEKHTVIAEGGCSKPHPFGPEHDSKPAAKKWLLINGNPSANYNLKRITERDVTIQETRQLGYGDNS